MSTPGTSATAAQLTETSALKMYLPVASCKSAMTRGMSSQR